MKSIRYNKEKNTIVILCYYHFPCRHPVLENVFAKELGRCKKIIWLFQSSTLTDRRQKWHNSEVILTKAFPNNSIKGKLLNRFLSFHRLFQLVRLLQKNNIGILLIRDLPVIAFFASCLKAMFEFKLYYQYSAPLSDKDIAYSKICRAPVKYYYFIRGYINGYFTKKVLRRANLVFPISIFHKNELAKICETDKLIPLTMGVDQDWIKGKREKVEDLENLKKSSLLITYFGTLNFSRNPIFILKVFKEIKKRCKNTTLILMGKAATQWEDNKLKTSCKNLGINNDVIFTGKLSAERLRDYLLYCDVSISAIPIENYFKISSPTKIYESLGNGIPVVANKGIYEQEKVINESGGGILVNYNIISFADGVVELLKNDKKRRKMAEDGRTYVYNNYTYKTLADNIAAYF